MEVLRADKPSGQVNQNAGKDKQAVATEPELHVRIEYVLKTMPCRHKIYMIALSIQVFWIAVLRYKHLQRSSLVKLTKHLLHGRC